MIEKNATGVRILLWAIVVIFLIVVPGSITFLSMFHTLLLWGYEPTPDARADANELIVVSMLIQVVAGCVLAAISVRLRRAGELLGSDLVWIVILLLGLCINGAVYETRL